MQVEPPVPPRHSDARPRWWLRCLLGLLLVGAWVGCASTPATVVDNVDRPVVGSTESPQAAERFAEAQGLYASGAFRAAAEAFQLLLAEFPNDAVSVPAELHLARCFVAMGQLSQARQIFSDLRSAAPLASDRRLATLYLAFVEGVAGEMVRSRDLAVAAVREAPDARVTEFRFVAGDGGLLAALLAEARIERGDHAAAVGDLEDVASLAADEALLLYAWDRASQTTETTLGLAELVALAASDSPFALAVTGAPLVSALLQAGDPDGARTALARARPAMEDALLTDRLQTATAMVASTGAAGARYGVILSLTGPDRRAGRAALGGILLAQQAFLDVDPSSAAWIEDVGGLPALVESAVSTLADAGVAVIIGPLEPALAQVTVAAASRRGIPVLSLAPPVGGGVSGAWHMQVDPDAEAWHAIRYAMTERGVRRFAMVVDAASADDQFLGRFAARARHTIEAEGGSLVFESRLDATDLQSSAAAAAGRLASNPEVDVVVLALPSTSASALLAYAAQQNIWSSAAGATRTQDGRRAVTWIGNSFVPATNVLRDAGSYLEHAILPVWFLPEIAAGPVLDFHNRFQTTYGRPASAVEAFAFDAASVARRLLLDEGRTDPARAADRLRQGLEHRGAAGAVTLNAEGAARVPLLVTVRAGAYATLP